MNPLYGEAQRYMTRSGLQLNRSNSAVALEKLTQHAGEFLHKHIPSNFVRVAKAALSTTEAGNKLSCDSETCFENLEACTAFLKMRTDIVMTLLESFSDPKMGKFGLVNFTEHDFKVLQVLLNSKLAIK